MAQTTINRFIGQLLAPIAATDEQADTKAFRSQIKKDMRYAWHVGLERIELARAVQKLAEEAFKMSGERYITDGGPAAQATWAALENRMALENAQCLIPAPSLKELRWKLRTNRYRKDIPAAVQAAIAADQARFDPTLEG